MNSLHDSIITGTIGELLVQLRLFQYGVQAAPPLKDSGNDLIAVRGEVFRAIQVKTTAASGTFRLPSNRKYHILALVRLKDDDQEYLLDKSEVFLLERSSCTQANVRSPEVSHKISQILVDRLFPISSAALSINSDNTQRS